MLEIFGRHKINRATERSSHGLRHALNCVLLDGIRMGRPRLVATDGHMLAIVPLTPADAASARGKGKDVDGLIDREAFERGMAGARGDERRRVELTKDEMRVHDGKGNLLVTLPRSRAKGEFPDYAKAMPKARSQEHVMKINPARLGKLVAVLGLSPREDVALHFDTNDDGVVVNPIRVTETPWSGDSVPHGALMPGEVNAAQRANVAKLDSVRDVPELPAPTAKKVVAKL